MHVRRIALGLVPLIAVACGSTAQSPDAVGPSATPASAPGTTTAPAATTTSPARFTSRLYGYSVAVPAGWTSVAATTAWDGDGAPGHEEPEADQWMGTGSPSAWAFAAPTTKGLAAYVRERIRATFADHGDTCPERPATQERVAIGGLPGVLVAWDCGILINGGFVVHHGVGYAFGFRDPAVHAATDPTDRQTFVTLLASARLPG